MAVVVWVFSGGGEAEVRGLFPLLTSIFPALSFERRFPVGIKANPKKLPRYGSDAAYKAAQKNHARGATGKNLCEQIKKSLTLGITHDQHADLILIFDDLDCHDAQTQCGLFRNTIQEVLVANSTCIPYLIAFAAPELEAWLIADWQNTMALDNDFRQHAYKIQQCLKQSTKEIIDFQQSVDFQEPESFSHFSPKKQACEEKLSAKLQACCKANGAKPYTKDSDTARMIKKLKAENVAQRCPHFKHLYTALTAFVRDGSVPSCCPSLHPPNITA